MTGTMSIRWSFNCIESRGQDFSSFRHCQAVTESPGGEKLDLMMDGDSLPAKGPPAGFEAAASA
jgi:hypothetical protein